MRNQLSKLLLIVVLALSFVAVFPFVPTVKADETTATIYSETDDGYIIEADSNYTVAQQDTDGDSVIDDGIGASVGQYIDTYYYIHRSFLFFDTSTIPDGANITEAKISLYIYSNDSVTDFNITVQNGQPIYPHQPLESGDYYYNYYSGDGGKLDTSTLSVNAYNNITLNVDGRGWLNLAGTTKLCLRSSRDIDATQPSGNEYVSFRTIEFGQSFAPKLYVSWEADYTFYGVYDEDTGLLKSPSQRAINVTAYFSDGTAPETFEVNGTYGYTSSSVPLYFHFDTSEPREYWLPSQEGGEDIYIFDTSLTTYTIAFLDLSGTMATYAWVSASKYINGSLYVVEKRKADIDKKIVMNLKNGQTYTIKIETDAGTSHTYGDLLLTSTTSVELTIKGVEFPKETLLIYANVRIYGHRILGVPYGNITIIYQDLLNQTVSVAIAINYKNGTSVYNGTETADSFVHVWSSALNNTDYRVEVTIIHGRYGTYGWYQYFPRSLSNPPWSLEFLGDLPFDTANIIPALLIVVTGGCFSVINVALGAFVFVIMASFFSYMGWIPIPGAILIVAFALAVMLALIYAKRNVMT